MCVGDVIDGKYELVRFLGRGGMASVFETTHLRIGRQLAIKILHAKHQADPVMVERFLREARAAAAIGSTYIVEVTDAGETDEGLPYLVMEYLEGSDLAAVLKHEGWLSVTRALTLTLQACSGLSAAHGQGIIHRDLKPENLFLVPNHDGQEQVKILDFGIALLREPLDPHDPRLTTAGELVGTPCYMSPEQALGRRELDHRVDVFCLGAVLYEILTGTQPFQGQSVNELIVAITTSDPIPPRTLRPELDPVLERIVLRAMARDPNERYDSIAEFGNDISTFLRSPQDLTHLQAGSGAVGASSDQEAEGLSATAVVPTNVKPAVQQGSQERSHTKSQERSHTKRSRLALFFLFTFLSIVTTVALILALGFGEAELPDDEGNSSPRATVSTSLSSRDSGGDVVPRSLPDSDEVEATRPTIEMKIRIEPPSARLKIDGMEAIPETQGLYLLRFPRDDLHHRLDAFAPGHRKRSLLVNFDQDQDLKLKLLLHKRRTPSVELRQEKGPSTIDMTNPYRRNQ